MTVHWAWGLVPSTLGAWYYGDSWAEYIVMTSMGTPLGLKAGQVAGRGITRGAGSGVWWLATRSSTKVLGGAALRAAGSVAAAIVVPVAVGYAVSYLIDENTGVENFTEFITGGVSPKQYFDAVTLSSMR